MFFRLVRRVLAPAVMGDADRLIENHEAGAAFLVRHILSATHDRGSGEHWRRVLAEIERRLK